MGVLKVSWRFVAGVVIAMLAAGVLFALLTPEPPSEGHPENASYSSYREGGARCDPARLARLQGGNADVERDRCAEGAEEHRLKSEDLVQQTRAADAAEVMAGLTYHQTVMMAAGTSIGFLTLVAAFFAVLYARKAGSEAQRAATAAEGQLTEAAKATTAELRPYLFVDRLELIDRRSASTEEKDEDGEPIPGMFSARVVIYLRNFGKVPARNVQVFIKEYVGARYRGRFWRYSFSKIDVPICAPNHERRVFGFLYIRPEERFDFDIGYLSKIIRLRFTFEDDLGNSFTERAAYIMYGGDLETFYLMTDVRVAELRRKAKEVEAEFDFDDEAEEGSHEKA